MAIRFLSFEWYREQLGSLTLRFGSADQQQLPPGQYTRPVTFFAGLASGLTEAIMVVTPAEVCKIRMQSQYNSMVDPAQLKNRKYTNVLQTATVIVREEGIGALYKGVVPTMMRQGCNQAVNFTTYNWFKDTVIQWRKNKGEGNIGLRPWESLVLGGISGGFGPMVNNPLGECSNAAYHLDRLSLSVSLPLYFSHCCPSCRFLFVRSFSTFSL